VLDSSPQTVDTNTHHYQLYVVDPANPTAATVAADELCGDRAEHRLRNPDPPASPLRPLVQRTRHEPRNGGKLAKDRSDASHAPSVVESRTPAASSSRSDPRCCS
jgi:hypothetical protein